MFSILPSCGSIKNFLLRNLYFRRIEFACNPALAHYIDPIAHMNNLRQFGRNHDNTDALICQLMHQLVDFVFEPTSIPLVGSSKIKTPGSVSSALTMTTFCWLPPLKFFASCRIDGVFTFKSRIPFVTFFRFLIQVDHSAFGDLIQTGQGDISPQIGGEYQAVPFPVLRQIHHAGVYGFPWILKPLSLLAV